MWLFCISNWKCNIFHCFYTFLNFVTLKLLFFTVLVWCNACVLFYFICFICSGFKSLTSGLLHQSKYMEVRLFHQISSVVSVTVCVLGGFWSCVSLCCPMMDWWPVYVLLSLLPTDNWDRGQLLNQPVTINAANAIDVNFFEQYSGSFKSA